jgi:hypothetical protein
MALQQETVRIIGVLQPKELPDNGLYCIKDFEQICIKQGIFFFS